MTLFDLLFLLLVLASLVTLAIALLAAVRGRWSRALAIVRKFGFCLVAYLAIVAIVGFLSPQRVLRVGDPWCFDDWCLTVQNVAQAPVPPQVAYTVSLRLYSQARGISQRAKGAWIYVVDEQGHRYAPEPYPSATPLDVLLQPGESVTTTRTFKVPANAGKLGLITGHGGPFNPGVIIIGDEASLLHKPTFVRIP
jgi:hypothetical protein